MSEPPWTFYWQRRDVAASRAKRQLNTMEPEMAIKLASAHNRRNLNRKKSSSGFDGVMSITIKIDVGLLVAFLKLITDISLMFK